MNFRDPRPNDNNRVLGQAVPVAGLYFYKIELEKAKIGANLGCFLSSQGQPATVSFFTTLQTTLG